MDTAAGEVKKDPVLLHGVLHVTIFQVNKLSGPACFRFFCKMVEKIEEGLVCGKGFSKLYATIDLDKARIGRTRQLPHPRSDPKWHQSSYVYCAHMASNLIFSIKLKDPIGAEVIGQAFMPVSPLLHNKQLDQWLPIFNRNHKPLRRGAKIHVRVEFLDATKSSTWSKGITSPGFPGVPYTFFPQRNGCRVTLYQDAHVPDDFDPKISLLGSENCYQQHRCWEDVFDAICDAKKFVYITGWSVYSRISLVRDSRRRKGGGEICLGELLKKKADEGVRVLMLVWDDKTSLKLVKKDGVMATHDEDTRSYFHNTKVHCMLCPRNPDNWRYIVQDLEISTMFTHHQKSVVVDSRIMGDGESEKRRIVSFIGGIDLCDGRYDNPSHSLFRTLDNVHQNDFYQHSIAGASISKGGPRQPWHDIHCRLEGPVAWDVLTNFEQRWRKQGGKKELLVPVTQADSDFVPQDYVFPEDHKETWNVQVFRSIDGGAVSGFPEDDPEAAARSGLVSWKDNIVDRSIQNAYINAIRRAKNFIYVENQYFIGSSFSWKSSHDIDIEHVGASNLIPKELSLKIASKIKAGERFSVYIVLPMWPEGVPDSGTVQAILKWQNKTMQMMYSDIAQTLHSEGLDSNPKDYLSFFCLGNREAKKSPEFQPPEAPEQDSHYYRAQEARRFMIYVHAKMMIVDDEYIIIGSANINQRSMDGARDSEIAMGAYQPNYLANRNQARGQIHGFRMSLWYEHLGRCDELFRQPETQECIRTVNQIAATNWDLYAYGDLESDDLPSHLLTYPIVVASNGDIVQLPGIEYFPDTKARVAGSKSDVLPSLLTT